MAVPVDIFVKDESSVPVVMPGVSVGIFSPGTHTQVAGAVTDSAGLAAFSLPGSVSPGTSYEVRLYKLGVDFHGLHTIQVLEPATSVNKFDVHGTDTNILPVSGSSLLCCCTGVFLDLRGQPRANQLVRFMAQGKDIDKTPKVFMVPSAMVAADDLELRTDSNGRISTNLIRTACYKITFAGDDDTVWDIKVPDQYAVNLIDLIHPFPQLWDWDDTVAPGDAVTLAVEASVEVPIVVTFTDYSDRSLNLSEFFDLVIADGSIVQASYDNNRGILAVTGKAAGTTTITPQLKTGIQPARWPMPTVTAPALTITVT